MKRFRVRTLSIALVALLVLGACAPAYQPRPVLVPESCDLLIRRASEDGVNRLSRDERAQLGFCQQQMLVRAEEEQAAAARVRVERDRQGQIAAYALSAIAAIMMLTLPGAR